jgi:hypothetical protein
MTDERPTERRLHRRQGGNLALFDGLDQGLRAQGRAKIKANPSPRA